MIKSLQQNKILSTLSRTLPDDRPITAIQIVEYVDKCPKGFVVINKTYDQDQDADLWREQSFLKRKPGRYLCISKSEGLPNFVVQEIVVLHEKTLPPDGYSLLIRTADTEQKAWRKKQLCYRLVKCTNTTQAVTDIIVCSRLKKAPSGFILAGEINGMTVCYKMGNVQDTANSESNAQTKPEAVFPHARPPPPRPAPPVPPAATNYPSSYPNLTDTGDHDYEILLPQYIPTRPAPRPPASNYSTLNMFQGLEGVPFSLNAKFCNTRNELNQLPVIKARTMQELMRDYNYDFTIERQS